MINNTRRVVVTGIGIISCIGNNQQEVLKSLQSGTSGIIFAPDYAEMGFRSQVKGQPEVKLEDHIDKRALRFMGDGAAYAYISMRQAIEDAGLEDSDVVNERTGLIVGTGGPSTRSQTLATDIAREKGVKRIGPTMVPKAMSSTASAVLSTQFHIKGINYSITSACSTSAHCIGNAVEQIQWGKQDVMFAGGGEELDWTLSCLFDAMGAMSSKYNETPEKASRAYDINRDGFVIAGGGGIIVLEELERAKARGARIYAEVTGYGATSDGHDMVAPSGEGATRCMLQAIQTIQTPVTYINTHGTSTPVGDITELKAIKEVFDTKEMNIPAIGSTKSMTGHSLGATGVQEAIYSMLMLEHKFTAPSINIEELSPEAREFPIAITREDHVEHNTILSNSFGFGGTNATLALSKFED